MVPTAAILPCTTVTLLEGISPQAQSIERGLPVSLAFAHGHPLGEHHAPSKVSTQTLERETGYRPGSKSVAILIDVSSRVSEWSRCPLHLDHPIIAITRAYQCARNNWDFDPQGIERSSDAGGLASRCRKFVLYESGRYFAPAGSTSPQ